jgi:hypothetical protein
VLLPFEKPPKISHITLSGPCAAGNRRFLPWTQGRRMKILKKGLTAKANKAKKFYSQVLFLTSFFAANRRFDSPSRLNFFLRNAQGIGGVPPRRGEAATARSAGAGAKRSPAKPGFRRFEKAPEMRPK